MAPHDGMDGMETDTGSMGPGSMNSDSPLHAKMVFQSTLATPLYSLSWTPASTAGYAGTCVFLVLLAAALRALLALKGLAEQRWLDRELGRRYVVVEGRQPLGTRISRDSLAKRMTLSENGVEENVMVVGKQGADPRPWRLSVDPVRAVLDTVIVGVGYLLMLAVMTMNYGYFLSILGGTFVGSIAVGRYTATGVH